MSARFDEEDIAEVIASAASAAGGQMSHAAALLLDAAATAVLTAGIDVHLAAARLTASAKSAEATEMGG